MRFIQKMNLANSVVPMFCLVEQNIDDSNKQIVICGNTIESLKDVLIDYGLDKNKLCCLNIPELSDNIFQVEYLYVQYINGMPISIIAR